MAISARSSASLSGPGFSTETPGRPEKARKATAGVAVNAAKYPFVFEQHGGGHKDIPRPDRASRPGSLFRFVRGHVSYEDIGIRGILDGVGCRWVRKDSALG